MFITHLSTSWLTLLGLSVTMVLTGCNNLPNIAAPDTAPIHTPATHHQTSNDNNFTKCPPL